MERPTSPSDGIHSMNKEEYAELTDASPIGEKLISAAVCASCSRVDRCIIPAGVTSVDARETLAHRALMETVVGLFAYSLEEERSAQLDNVDDELDALLTQMLAFSRRSRA